MSNFLQHPQFGQIRTRKRGDEFFFCGKDLCSVLEIIDHKQALSRLDDDQRGWYNTYTPGGNQKMIYVSESGLYELILQSRKPEARKFRKWITSEVLPALRKYGVYSTDSKQMDRAAKRLAQKTVNRLLDEIDSQLSATDKRIIARQCQTDEYEVSKVLHGHQEDAYMLTLLYSRATGNKLLRQSFYTQAGAEKLLAELQKSKTTAL